MPEKFVTSFIKKKNGNYLDFYDVIFFNRLKRHTKKGKPDFVKKNDVIG